MNEEFHKRLEKLEKMLGIFDNIEENHDMNAEILKVVDVEEHYPRMELRDIERDILLALRKGQKTARELLFEVKKKEICSQATLFRYLKRLLNHGKIKKRRRGKFVLYALAHQEV